MMVDRSTYEGLMSLFTSQGLEFNTFMHTWDYLEATGHTKTLAASAPLLLPTAFMQEASMGSGGLDGSSVVVMSEWLARKSRAGSKGSSR